MKTESIATVRARFRDVARADGVNPRDIDVLLADVTGRTQAWLFAHGEERIDPAAVDALMARRLRGEPLQYIRGRAEFFGREFLVDDRVLIPRPETELLVEAAIARAPAGARVLDIGSGSGCIAISLERERPDLEVTSIDVSLAALAVARRNARAHTSPVLFAASDVFSAVGGGFDLIVSNPPYIPAAGYERLATEVRDYEPRGALTPGPRGTELIERILAGQRAPVVLLEIGFGQIDDVRQVTSGYEITGVINDLAGIERVVVLSRHGRK
ncbi:MAG TPA: peptide chain release factor N(5)-glutamine methyltransferase [Thermoanaerobaculia bacterium]|jgi:release factor glutamine methyltransferase|nr:peptide chain release factor N(5)-glutamine methyltransferase [Thermoanaerobaculia bacterium]